MKKVILTFVIGAIVGVVIFLATMALLPDERREVEDIARSVLAGARAQLSNPADDQTNSILRDFLKENLGDFARETNWRDYFYYFTFFESLDGWGLADSSGGFSGADFQSVALATGTTLDDESSIGKDPVYQDILDYDKPAKFRTAFQLGSVASEEFFAGIGVGGNGAVGNHYGFLVVGGTLYGVVGNGAAQTTVTLLTGVSASYSYLVEAEFYPGDKVVFKVKRSDETELVERGVINTGMPTGPFTNWAMFDIINKVGGAGSAKTANFSFFEYIQKR